MPKWMKVLLECVCESCLCEVQGRMTGFSVKWSRPSENGWGVWLVDVAPVPVELVGGVDDGESVFDPVDVDLLTLSVVMDCTRGLYYHPASPQEEAHFVVEGEQGKRQVAIRIWLEPFSDEEPATVFDVREGSWRPKRM